MQKVITEKLIKKELKRQTFAGRAIMTWVGIFALACLMIPNIIVVLVIDIPLVIIISKVYKSMKKDGYIGKISNMYFKVMPLDKKTQSHYDDDSGSTEYLRFGDTAISVKYSDFKSAEPGKCYYVGFFDGNEKGAVCFSVDEYIPDKQFKVYGNSEYSSGT